MKRPLKPIALLLALTTVVIAAVLADITYGRLAQDTHASSALAAAQATATPPQTTGNAAAGEVAEASEAPEATDAPKPTEAPEATELPNAAAPHDHDQSEAPEATDAPKPTEASELPNAAASDEHDQPDADDALEQPEPTDAPAARAPVVTAAQAQATVLAANPGTTVTEIELDDDDGASVYKITLNTGTKVKVDAQSGKIISVKLADGDD